VRAVPQNQHGAGRHQQLNQRLELCLERSLPDARLNALFILALKARLLVVLARESLHDTD